MRALPKRRWRDYDTGELIVKPGMEVCWTPHGTMIPLIGTVTEVRDELVYVMLKPMAVVVATSPESPVTKMVKVVVADEVAANG